MQISFHKMVEGILTLPRFGASSSLRGWLPTQTKQLARRFANDESA